MSKGVMTIGRNEAIKALGDEKFMSQFPMFRTIKGKADVMQASGGSSGCSSCRRGTIMSNLTLDFQTILGTLPEGTVRKIKDYFGVDRLMYTALDRQSGVYMTKVV